ncbi:hypothetical protein [Paraburkholderia youngii]|uniref:hypothetical protein n=1 Tax=Paraburkholderia youngii TaxID=2782701 RepID=UPI003D20E6AF
MTLFEHYRSIDAAFTLASAGTGLAALGAAFLCSTAITLMHEFAHLVAARCFGLRGRLAFFALRGKSRVWFFNIMAANFDEAESFAIGAGRLRVVIASGPVCHTALTVLCLYMGLSLQGPAWLGLGVALAGAIYAPISLLNFIPLPFGTDGWRLLWPITEEMRAASQRSRP